ncbi:two-component system OmpR family sensor kinase [Antricoccus suffuscus]|uniref:histidine kinase n=1 Tax=Antricoccus suffuscus TaxID=1629062 RepID=A0A2T0ZYQ9_9ACTN|nr:HAMP domain-containing sensor histidine kinase [Antricoccus suffuscus]PRZ41480.1 two-component system OmpR family sensor kinase [Antricoccus suffuscus]
MAQPGPVAPPPVPPPPEVSRVRRGRPWTLRKRLVVGLTGLLAIAIVIIGTATPIILHQFLVARVDQSVQSASDRSIRVVILPPDNANDPGGHQNGPEFLLQPGQAEGTVGALKRDGRLISAAVLDSRGNPGPIPGSALDQLNAVKADGKIRTVHLGGLGDYRVIAVQTGNDVRITGIPMSGSEATVRRLVIVELAVAGSVLIIAALAGAGVVGWSLRPLRRITATARRVSEMPLHEGQVLLAERVPPHDADGRTEVGQVGAALNQMLGHMQHAFDARHRSEMRLRTFIADASHELRTPLAAIRGYAELTRRSPEPIPAEVAHAIGRVESEGARMTTLVEDLLLLVRLDSGRPLAHETVDLSAIVIDAVGDAHAAGPDHNWLLEIPDDPVEITGDALRMHQVLANLLANARTHTPAGTTVTTSVESRDGSAIMTVADDGPGISPELLPNVFDRFARGDSSRSRGNGSSTGLGLAIVSAIVASHGGRVEVQSAQGSTRFMITIPVGVPPMSASGPDQ